MKTYLIVFFCCLTLGVKGQFNQTYFGKLAPSLNGIPKRDFGNGFHCIGTNYGALAVRFADSLNKEIQWVKTDLAGNDLFYSADKPYQFTGTEHILGLFEESNFQYIVTTDSINQFGYRLRIYKYQNYTDLINTFQYTNNLASFQEQVYFRNGRLYVFGLRDDLSLISIQVEANSLSLVQDVVLYQSNDLGGNLNYTSRNVHAYFTSPDNYDVFMNKQSSLLRVRVVNNQVSNVQTVNLGIQQVIGVNETQQAIVCTTFDSLHPIRKYNLNVADLNQINLLEELSLPFEMYVSSNDWLYTSNGTIDYFVNSAVDDYRLYHFSSQNGSVLSSQIYQLYEVFPSSFYFHQGKLLFAGVLISSISNFTIEEFFPFISYNEIESLMDLEFYADLVELGSTKIRLGVGSQIVPLSLSRSTELFSYERLVYNLAQVAVTKVDNQLKGSYKEMFYQQFKPGPYTSYNAYNTSVENKYNKNLYVDFYMVNQHVASIQANDPTYQIPDGILKWPAHGDVNIGQSEFLAPFIDLNSNNLYEPTLGEYPSFPGTYCVLNISHQHEQDEMNTGSGLEFHTYLYSFDCSPVLDSTLFIRTEIYNRTNNIIDSLFFGYCADFDIGMAFDDYVGTHVENGLIYAYNGDSIDNNYGYHPQSYHNNCPSIGLQFLKGNKQSLNLMDDEAGVGPYQSVNGYGFGDGLVDNEYLGMNYSAYFTNGAEQMMADPNKSIEWKNYLSGKWRNGAPIYFGGDAYQNQTTSLETRYVFPDESDPQFAATNGVDPGQIWDASVIVQYDHRILGSFGSTSLIPDQKVEYHAALFHSEPFVGVKASLPSLFLKASEVKTMFNTNITPCQQSFSNIQQQDVTGLENGDETSFLVYPNPFDNSLTIELSSIDATSVRIFDLQGKQVFQETIFDARNEIQLPQLTKGIYLIELSNTQGQSSTRKLIKN